MKLPTWILGAIALTALGSTALTEIALAETSATPAALSPTPEKVPAPPPLPEITSNQFNRMRLGMTVAEITTLLGRSDMQEPNWTEADSGTMAYQWQLQGSDRMVQVVFHNGRMVGRTAWTMPLQPSPTLAPEAPTNPAAPTQNPVKPQ
jgi:hypothetical protein